MTISQIHASSPSSTQPFSDRPNIPRRPNSVHIKIVGICEQYPPYTIYTKDMGEVGVQNDSYAEDVIASTLLKFSKATFDTQFVVKMRIDATNRRLRCPNYDNMIEK